MIVTKNRKYAFCIGIISTIGGWFSLILMTQDNVKIKRRHYIGLGLAIVAYILWWAKFCYTVESN